MDQRNEGKRVKNWNEGTQIREGKRIYGERTDQKSGETTGVNWNRENIVEGRKRNQEERRRDSGWETEISQYKDVRNTKGEKRKQDGNEGSSRNTREYNDREKKLRRSKENPEKDQIEISKDKRRISWEDEKQGDNTAEISFIPKEKSIETTEMEKKETAGKEEYQIRKEL